MKPALLALVLVVAAAAGAAAIAESKVSPDDPTGGYGDAPRSSPERPGWPGSDELRAGPAFGRLRDHCVAHAASLHDSWFSGRRLRLSAPGGLPDVRAVRAINLVVADAVSLRKRGYFDTANEPREKFPADLWPGAFAGAEAEGEGVAGMLLGSAKSGEMKTMREQILKLPGFAGVAGACLAVSGNVTDAELALVFGVELELRAAAGDLVGCCHNADLLLDVLELDGRGGTPQADALRVTRALHASPEWQRDVELRARLAAAADRAAAEWPDSVQWMRARLLLRSGGDPGYEPVSRALGGDGGERAAVPPYVPAPEGIALPPAEELELLGSYMKALREVWDAGSRTPFAPVRRGIVRRVELLARDLGRPGDALAEAEEAGAAFGWGEDGAKTSAGAMARHVALRELGRDDEADAALAEALSHGRRPVHGVGPRDLAPNRALLAGRVCPRAARRGAAAVVAGQDAAAFEALVAGVLRAAGAKPHPAAPESIRACAEWAAAHARGEALDALLEAAAAGGAAAFPVPARAAEAAARAARADGKAAPAALRALLAWEGAGGAATYERLGLPAEVPGAAEGADPRPALDAACGRAPSVRDHSFHSVSASAEGCAAALEAAGDKVTAAAWRARLAGPAAAAGGEDDEQLGLKLAAIGAATVLLLAVAFVVVNASGDGDADAAAAPAPAAAAEAEASNLGDGEEQEEEEADANNDDGDDDDDDDDDDEPPAPKPGPRHRRRRSNKVD